MQKYTSKNTSINSKKLPAIFGKVARHYGWTQSSVNFDIGGGKFDNASTYLKEQYQVENLIFDPHNRSDSHNATIIRSLSLTPADTATISNVLNVICERDIQKSLIQLAHDNLKVGGLLFITVYEGNKSGIGKQTGKDQWQENKRLCDYKVLIEEVFTDCNLKGGMLVAVKH